MNQRRRDAWRRLLAACKWAFAACLLCYLFRSGKISFPAMRFNAGVAFFLGLGILCQLASKFASFVRYWLIGRGCGIKAGFFTVLSVWAVAMMFESVGGVFFFDAARIAYTGRMRSSLPANAAAVFLDRALALGSLLVLAAGGAFLFGGASSGFPSGMEALHPLFGASLLLSWMFLSWLAAMSLGGWAAWVSWAAWGAYVFLASGINNLGIGFAAAGAVVAAAIILGVGAIHENTGRLRSKSGKEAPWRAFFQFAFGSRLPNNPGIGPAVFALSLSSHALAITGLYLLGLSLSMPDAPAYVEIWVAAPPAILTQAIPLPGGAVGVGEALFDHLVGILRTASNRDAIAGSASIFLLSRCLGILTNLIGLPFYLKSRFNEKGNRAYEGR